MCYTCLSDGSGKIHVRHSSVNLFLCGNEVKGHFSDIGAGTPLPHGIEDFLLEKMGIEADKISEKVCSDCYMRIAFHAQKRSFHS